jgi:hypothetical protein
VGRDGEDAGSLRGRSARLLDFAPSRGLNIDCPAGVFNAPESRWAKQVILAEHQLGRQMSEFVNSIGDIWIIIFTVSFIASLVWGVIQSVRRRPLFEGVGAIVVAVLYMAWVVPITAIGLVLSYLFQAFGLVLFGFLIAGHWVWGQTIGRLKKAT